MKGLYCVEASFRSIFSTTTPLPQKTLPPPPPLQKNPKTKQNKKNIFFFKRRSKSKLELDLCIILIDLNMFSLVYSSLFVSKQFHLILSRSVRSKYLFI